MDMFGQEWANHALGCKSCQNSQICMEWLETVKSAQKVEMDAKATKSE